MFERINRMNTKGLIAVSVAGLLAGCASTSGAKREPTNSAATPPAQGSGMGTMADKCPVKVSGTKVMAADVEGGAALAFTTSSGDVAELRQRVRGMAEMHDRKHATGGMMMPASTASAEDVEGGARLVLRPKDPAQLEGLRKHARMHAEKMSSGECPMMAPHGAQAPPSPSAGDGDHQMHHQAR
jgi:hypothetical protein